MLVPAMNNAEVTAAILTDLDKIRKTTIQRLLDEYARERKKLGVDKTNDYVRNYPIKTAAKNTWIIFIQKQPDVARFKTSYDAVACSIVYYYSKRGLKVFRYQSRDNFMEVFNGHFFTRYNERMKLNLNYQVDIIKAFFTNNTQIDSLRKPEGKKTYIFGTCTHGATLGEWHDDINWLVHKTFINHDLKRRDQRAEEQHITLLKQFEELRELLGDEWCENNQEILEMNNTPDAQQQVA